MTIREEFEKALSAFYEDSEYTATEKEIALWAAKWMAERCAKRMESYGLRMLAADAVTKEICAIAAELDK